MDADQIAIATSCMVAAHDGSLSFPEILGKLISAGFEGYAVDYRRSTQTYYMPDGANIELDMPESSGFVAEVFDVAEVARLIRWAQSGDQDYSYGAFSEQAKAAGCAGYLVSFLGRRVTYYGRTAETHVELFPQ